jgi:hypothetical protein
VTINERGIKPPRTRSCRITALSKESARAEIKNEDEICTSSLSSSTIPLTSGIEEAPQLLLSVVIFLPYIVARRKPLYFLPPGPGVYDPLRCAKGYS